jgi:hypothetical protein
MTVRAIFSECSIPMWIDVARRLEHESGWEPVYWTGSRGILDAVEYAFPNCVLHDNFAACRSLPAPELIDLPRAPVDEALLADLAPYESIALRMMDRLDPGGAFSFSERVRHYHHLIGYWQAVLEEIRPDVFVTPVSPHLVYDYVLYRLCVREGIRTVMFHETTIGGLMYPFERFEEGSPALAATVAELARRGGPARLSERSTAFLARTRESYDAAMPDYIRELLDDVQGSAVVDRTGARRTTGRPEPIAEERPARSVPANAVPTEAFPQRTELRTQLGLDEAPRGTAIAHAIDRLLETCELQGRRNPEGLADALALTTYLYEAVEREYPYRFRFGDEAPANYLKRSSSSPASGSLSNLEYWLYRLVAKRDKGEFATYYAERVEPIDPLSPYVYFALPYQPEKSTSPEAGPYADLVTAAELLSRTVPEGWRIAVREHPFQWNTRGSGEQCRSLQFYDDLLALPNVQLVSLETSPFELMDLSRAVVTMTGTSGFEAVVRGVPVLAFGHAWYLPCEGVFNTMRHADLVKALECIDGGYRPQKWKVDLFVEALETIGFRGYSIPDLAEGAEIGNDENVDGFTRALRDWFAGGDDTSLRVAG